MVWLGRGVGEGRSIREGSGNVGSIGVERVMGRRVGVGV